MEPYQGVVEFVRVVESGSFSAAARTLGKSKAYVSQRVRQLEDRLGSRLLQRTTRSLKLTDAGRVYFRFAEQALGKLDEAEEQARDFQENLKGAIKVSLVDGGLGDWYLAPVLVRFAAQNPQVSLELDLSSRLVDLVAEGYDFAVRVGNLKDSSLVARKLTAFRFGLYASPAYLERQGLVAHPGDLKAHNCLSGASPRWSLSCGVERIEFSPQGSWHSKSGQVLIRAACEGLGIVRTATFYAADALAAGDLVEVLPEWTSEKSPVWIVSPSRRNIPRRVAAAMNFLCEAFHDVRL